MVAILPPTDEEMYLLAILTDESGIDQAEFSWHEPKTDDGLYRAYDYQWPLYSDMSMYQIDQGARATGKTYGMQLRAFSFPFLYPGETMLITAPELNHLKLITDDIEQRILSTRITRELLKTGKGSNGFTRNPQWNAKFLNGAEIDSRLPNRDGKGVKGQHVLKIEMDESQDYPPLGWNELEPVLNYERPGARWFCHGVPTGARNRYWELTEGQINKGDQAQWKVHRPMAMNRPTWGDAERKSKIAFYGGSTRDIAYRRNIYGEHGDASSAVFVLSKLMQNVDTDIESMYNTNIYFNIKLILEHLSKDISNDSLRTATIRDMLTFPSIHKTGYSQKGPKGKEVGSPKGYISYWAGMDVGVTNDPSEILVSGEREDGSLELLTRLNLQRLNIDDQMLVIKMVFEFYGDKLRAMGIDSTGVGQPYAEKAKREISDRVRKCQFSEKIPVGLDSRTLNPGEDNDDLILTRPFIEASTDWLRNDFVNPGRYRLPNDDEILREFQAQTYTVKSGTDPYGRTRSFSGNQSYHTLDAAKCMIAAKKLLEVEEEISQVKPQEDVIPIFFDSWEDLIGF